VRCTGTVVDGTGHVARVSIDSNACGDCHACSLGSASKDNVIEVNALNKVGAESGDPVFMEVSGSKVMKASAVIFLIPFAGFIIGFLTGYYPVWHLVGSSRTMIAVALAFAFLAASYYPVHLLGKRSDFEFVIKGMAHSNEPPPGPGAQAPPPRIS
jgi:positive regulator of sigma E activity